jgi:hypothetical protein
MVHSSHLNRVRLCGASYKFAGHMISNASFYIEHNNKTIQKTCICSMLFIILGGTILNAY